MLQLLSALGLFGTALMVFACLRLRRRGAAPAGRFPLLERLLAGAAGLSFVALALSGFGVRLMGSDLSGYLLLLHVGCGGVLAAAFTLALFFWGPRFAFDAEAKAGCSCYCAGHRLGFWLLALAVIGVIATPLAAMLPVLGTHGQEVLVVLHRLAALAAIALALGLSLAEARLRPAAG